MKTLTSSKDSNENADNNNKYHQNKKEKRRFFPGESFDWKLFHKNSISSKPSHNHLATMKLQAKQDESEEKQQQQQQENNSYDHNNKKQEEQEELQGHISNNSDSKKEQSEEKEGKLKHDFLRYLKLTTYFRSKTQPQPIVSRKTSSSRPRVLRTNATTAV